VIEVKVNDGFGVRVMVKLTLLSYVRLSGREQLDEDIDVNEEVIEEEDDVTEDDEADDEEVPVVDDKEDEEVRALVEDAVDDDDPV
jgi:hypothetical protein